MSAAAIAADLGRSLNAIQIRLRQVSCPINGRVPRFGSAPWGPKLYWTRERTLAGLQDFVQKRRGKLPTSDHEYSVLKKGHPEWPTAARVLEYFGTMADAWEAAGAPKGRYDRLWVPWTQEDDDLLLTLAGEMTLALAAKRLNRSAAACKRRLYDLGAGRARDVSGHMSAMQVAKEYGCPLRRVNTLIASGELRARKVTGGHYWRIEPQDAEAVAHLLRLPKQTHRATSPDQGDYDKRHGYRRIGGKRMPTTAAAQQRERRKEQKRREQEALRIAVRKLEERGLIRDFGVAS